MLVFGYVRVSTDQQERSGLGIEAQIEAITHYVERAGHTVEFIEDTGSGKFVNAGLRSALTRLHNHEAGALVVAKMDRIARSVAHAADVLNLAHQQGWNLVVLDIALDLGTPQGRAMAQMMSVFAELERAMISDRTREALAQRKRRGEPVGRPRLVAGDVVDRIVQERTGQHHSFGAIAKQLTSEGVLSPAGRPVWQASTVRRIFNSQKNLATNSYPQPETHQGAEITRV
jgi:DNA invertase Pin-like site-specific DNA recombinase